ncbi:MAG: DUF4302 domain-containing protein [Dysgonamonadaceae bacterium]|jgi:hypothetical protein|nr:DUF4302 domain-containing protein [Dysgonamonadaceae bacterium]
MRKNSPVYFLLSGLIFISASCVRTEEDLFEESAALRINRAVATAGEILLSAGNGWVMEYFPTNDSPGVTFLVKFNQNGMAVVAAKNEYTPQYTESEGTWDVIDDTGPVLTFDTYIDVLHLFSDPASGLGKGLGAGLEGDYEFIIMNASGETITLKGKKRGTDIRMYRLPGETPEWNDYFDSLDEMNITLFNQNASLLLSAGSASYTLSGGISHIFDAVPQNAAAGSEEIPFIVTNSGIRLAQPFKAGNLSVQTFKLSDDKSYLYAVENQDIRITNPTSFFPFFLDENNWTPAGLTWTVDTTALGGAFQTACAKVVSGCKTVYKEDFGSFFFKYKTNRRSKTLSFKSGTGKYGTYEGAFDFDIRELGEGKVIFTDKGTADVNAGLYKKNIDGFGEILALITSGAFTVTTDKPLSMSVLKFTSVDNPANWFTLSLNNLE